MVSIDLNADVGEYSSAGIDNEAVKRYWQRDAAIMPFISSANIACGAHAGDNTTMRETIRLALAQNVAVGAHPGFADRENFGRQVLELPVDNIYQLVASQVEQLQHIAQQEGTQLSHVKPHGALYNMAAQREDISQAILAACNDVVPDAHIVGLAGSCFLQVAKARGFTVRAEAFADRRYQADGRLASRELPGAVIASASEAARQALAIAMGQAIATIQGESISLRAQTICLHGDTPGAAGYARQLHSLLQKNGVAIRVT